jgi:hypothetical protein
MESGRMKFIKQLLSQEAQRARMRGEEMEQIASTLKALVDEALAPLIRDEKFLREME